MGKYVNPEIVEKRKLEKQIEEQASIIADLQAEMKVLKSDVTAIDNKVKSLEKTAAPGRA